MCASAGPTTRSLQQLGHTGHLGPLQNWTSIRDQLHQLRPEMFQVDPPPLSHSRRSEAWQTCRQNQNRSSAVTPHIIRQNHRASAGGDKQTEPDRGLGFCFVGSQFAQSSNTPPKLQHHPEPADRSTSPEPRLHPMRQHTDNRTAGLTCCCRTGSLPDRVCPAAAPGSVSSAAASQTSSSL